MAWRSPDISLSCRMASTSIAIARGLALTHRVSVSPGAYSRSRIQPRKRLGASALTHKALNPLVETGLAATSPDALSCML